MKELRTWELSEYEKTLLTTNELPIYNTAASYMEHEWAYGPYGGWGRGQDMLISLGWEEKVRSEGHRNFTSIHKPERFKNIMSEAHALQLIDGAIS